MSGRRDDFSAASLTVKTVTPAEVEKSKRPEKGEFINHVQNVYT